jgi:hypothetical protein
MSAGCGLMMTADRLGSPCIRFADCCCSRWRCTVLRLRTVTIADLRAPSSLAGAGGFGCCFLTARSDRTTASAGCVVSPARPRATRVFGSMVTITGPSIATGFRFRGGRL